MVTLASIIPSLQTQYRLVTLDLQYSYFRIAVHPAHRKYLKFIVGPRHY